MKKYRVRWGRLAILMAIITVFVAVLVMMVRMVWPDYIEEIKGTEEPEQFVTQEMLRCDSVMKRRVDGLMNVPQRLDTHNIAISIYDATSGLQVYNRHSATPLAPASCMKLVTALASLKRLGFDHRYTESIQIRGKMVGDTLKGNLLLRADADPLLESFDGLVKRVKAKGINVIDGNVYFHLAKVDTLRPHPSGKLWDIPYWKLPPLLKGERFVKRTFLYTLSINGIKVHKNSKIKPEGEYRVIAQSSHLMRDVLTPMLIHSSNIKAEAVFYHMDWKAGLIRNGRHNWNIHHDAEDYLKQTFGDMDKRFVINDGSGLSPNNRLSADFLVELLKYCYKDTKIRDYLINEGLATPSNGERRGSLLTRLSKAEYKNRIFVKTGTLTTIGTSSLAGYINGKDGHWYIFSIINSDSPVAESRIFQDRLCREILR